MVNCNPETVSTDYDTVDRLYFEPLTNEDVHARRHPRAGGRRLRSRASCSSAGRRRSSWRWSCRRPGSTSSARRPTPSIWPRTASGSHGCSGTWAFRRRRAASPPRARKRGARPAPSATRWWCGRRTSWAAGRWPSSTTPGALDRYMTEAVDASPEHPILVDKFLEDAFELDVDAVADATGAVVIGGIMEHIEQAGIHSGDSSCVVPPYLVPERHLEVIRDYTRRVARALKVVGLLNIQFAIKDDTVYILEVNPRASRTVPYLSKATGVPPGQDGGPRDGRPEPRRARPGRRPGRGGGCSSRRRCFRSSVFRASTRFWAPEMKSTGESDGRRVELRRGVRQGATGGRPAASRRRPGVHQRERRRQAEHAPDRPRFWPGSGSRWSPRGARPPTFGRTTWRPTWCSRSTKAVPHVGDRPAQPGARPGDQYAARARVVLRRSHRAADCDDARGCRASPRSPAPPPP